MQLYEWECPRSTGVEGSISRHQASLARADRGGEVEAILDGMAQLKGEGACRSEKRVVGHQPDGAGGKILLPERTSLPCSLQRQLFLAVAPDDRAGDLDMNESGGQQSTVGRYEG